VPELRGSDLALVTAQLGREPLTDLSVVARCLDGHPLVIRNHPLDRRGSPFPTLYWLTCPEAVSAVSRLESEGWIKRLDERARTDSEFGRALDASHLAYATERGRWAVGAEAWGGVGGSRAGVKCLHAHYANHLAGGEDPVGEWVAGRAEPLHRQDHLRERVAAVDMGTNSIRLLVAEERDGDIFELARDMVITRLGQAVDRTEALHPDALKRTMDVLARYSRRARALGARRIRVGATSAVRDVADRALLDRTVTEITGSPPEVLTGEQEAHLSFLGATAGLDREPPHQVFDIGGGSTELVLGETEADAAMSVDVGSVRITERVVPSDPPTEEDLRRMRALASEGLAAAERVVPPGRATTLIGVAGTTTTIQALALRLTRYDPEAIHRTVLERGEAERVTGELAAMTTAQRAALPVMAPGREDVIVAGAVILLEILRRWRFERCVVSERDILDGLALEMVQAG
jgi:exopolyphosphatase / guanosine-5'-triphosphate,3'-diphosphate pyrophosphatase